jgi:thioredoxin-like negative regulator of GroEL
MIFGKKNSIEAGEAELKQVLQSFRESVHAWSDAEYGRPRSAALTTVHHTWRWAAAWALGCVLALGGLSAGLYQRHQKELAANTAAQQKTFVSAAEAMDEAPATEAQVGQVAQIDPSEPDANLLAAVDSDVSRQVSSAMEPLAQLMENYSSQ